MVSWQWTANIRSHEHFYWGLEPNSKKCLHPRKFPAIRYLVCNCLQKICDHKNNDLIMENGPCPSKSSFVKSKMLRYSFWEHILVLMNWLNALILSLCCCRGLWVINPLSPWFLCLLISNVLFEHWSISFVGLLNSWKRWAPIHLSTWLGSLQQLLCIKVNVIVSSNAHDLV